jgi:transposase
MSGPERAARDEQIHRLRAEGRSVIAIAKRFNVYRSTVYEVLHPDRRAAYNARRRQHWRELAGSR